MKRYYLLGIPVDSIGTEEVYDKILQLSEQNKPSRVVLLDTYLLMKAQFSKELFGIIKSADLVLPISAGVRFGLKFLNKSLDKVYNYYNFLITLLLHFTEKNKFIYVLGGKNKLLQKINNNLRDSFPGIRIVGNYHCNYKKNFEHNLMTSLKKSSASLVLVGNSSPKQEKWIFRRISQFNQGVFIGVGDFVNIVGGKGASPSDKSIQSGFHGVKKLLKNPLKIYRLFYYSLYFPLLLLSKLSSKY